MELIVGDITQKDAIDIPFYLVFHLTYDLEAVISIKSKGPIVIFSNPRLIFQKPKSRAASLCNLKGLPHAFAPYFLGNNV